MAVFSIQRCNSDDEQIVFDTDNEVIRLFGRQASVTAPLHSAVLQHVEKGDCEGGVLSFGESGFYGNVQLTLAEYIQADHYFRVINQYNHEVTLQ